MLAVTTDGDRDGLPVEALPGGRWDLRGLRDLRAAMHEADVTVAHGSATLAACAIAGIGPGRPFVYRQISDPAYWTNTAARRLRVRWLYRFPTRVVSLSASTADLLKHRFQIPPDRITVIPNASDERQAVPTTDAIRADARRALAVDEGAEVIVYAGALAKEKGVHDLLSALTPGQVLLMAGAGPEADAIARTATQRGLDVRLLGVVNDLTDVYAAADLFVLPSWSEQQPGVLIEAALRALPCVATDVGVVDEVVRDGRTGLLVPPKDPDALRTAMRAILDDRPGSISMGLAARTHALASFSLTAVAARWAALLAELE